MNKVIKKIFFFLLFLFPIISFSNKLESISYRDGEINLKFSKKVPKYTENLDINLPSITLNFNDTEKSKNVEHIIEVNDFYLMDILSENYENQTDVVVYLKKSVDYTIKVTNNELKIKLKDQNITPKKRYTIVLDAGHGGHDTGARGGGYNEKDIALDVVLELYKDLKDYYNVILTRDKDIFIPLNERADIGNRNNADLFVSVHLNAASNTSARGTEVFYYSKNPSVYARQLAKYENSFDKKGARAIETSNFVISDVIYYLNQKQSAVLANTVLDEIVHNMETQKRKVNGANFAVLRGSNSNAILIELGFISNYTDRSKYITSEGKQKVAQAIANAIKKHY